MAGQRMDPYETERVCKGGRRILVSLTVSPIKDDAGNIAGVSKVVRDVTRQRRADERERRLLADAAAANAKFQAFFEQGALLAVIMELDGTIVAANRLSWEGCGYTREQIRRQAILGRSVVGVLAGAGATDQGGVRAGDRRLAVPRRDAYFVADGSERTADITIVPIKDQAGKVLFVAPTGIDITDRKRAEADRQKFVTLVETSSDFIAMSDLHGVPIFVNRAGLELVGLDDLEQARRVSMADFFFPDDRPKIMGEFFPSVLAQGHGEIEIRFRHFKTGEARWMAYKVLTLPTPPAGRWRSRRSARTSPSASGWPTICRKRTATRPSSSPRWRTSCETRSPRSATP
jgi:PAS domain S-box-containing protein